jgi:hypothetical protein
VLVVVVVVVVVATAPSNLPTRILYFNFFHLEGQPQELLKIGV